MRNAFLLQLDEQLGGLADGEAFVRWMQAVPATWPGRALTVDEAELLAWNWLARLRAQFGMAGAEHWITVLLARKLAVASAGEVPP
jgi:hypothetical protein